MTRDGETFVSRLLLIHNKFHSRPFLLSNCLSLGDESG